VSCGQLQQQHQGRLQQQQQVPQLLPVPQQQALMTLWHLWRRLQPVTTVNLGVSTAAAAAAAAAAGHPAAALQQQLVQQH
jgi:hypothetical protein